jgi:hypothetical protein
MNNPTPSLAELEARLAKLERQNRRWKHLGLLLLLIAGSGFLLAQAPRKPARAGPAPATPAASYDTLVVHRVELRDKAGKLRGVWTVDDSGSGLALYDTAGKSRVFLGVDAEGPALAFYDTAGKGRALLSATAEGSILNLSDATGKPRAALAVFADAPGLLLYDAAGKISARLSQDSLRLEDAQQFQAVVGVTETEVINMGERRTTSAAAVTLFGKDGKVIWRAP